MTETVRVVLTAAVLSAITIGYFGWRVSRFDRASPERLIGELRLAQWAALLLAASGAVLVGLAIAAGNQPTTGLDVMFGVGFVVLGGFILHREPREGLLLATLGFVLHTLVDIAHRPGWLFADLAPRWYAVGSAIFDMYIAAVCYWVRRS